MEISANVAIAWIDLTFKCREIEFKRRLIRFKERVILNKLSGKLIFGTITALMGPSGSGMTSLLKCINGVNTSGLGKETKFYFSPKNKINPCFVTQNDKENLIMSLTAKENLIYSSKLKNSNESEEIDYELNVNSLLDELMIRNTMNTRVENCSGGEQKRLTIALQMTAIRKPNLLCIDEPTTGLDSNATEVVIECLKKLTQKHSIATMTSIHQPNSDLLLMYDKIYVLAKGGNCVYFDIPENIETHLNECNIISSEVEVPIEVLIKIASKGVTDEQMIVLANKTREKHTNGIQSSTTGMKQSREGVNREIKRFKIIDLLYLLMRCSSETYLNRWKEIVVSFALFLSTAVMFGLLFNEHIAEPNACLDINYNQSNDNCLKRLNEDYLIEQNLRFLFMLASCILILIINSCVIRITPQVNIFLNEHRNGWYSTGAFITSQILIDCVNSILYTTSATATAYYLIGQNSEFKRFLKYNLSVNALSITVVAYCYLFGILFNDKIQVALLTSYIYGVISEILSNYMILNDDMNGFFEFISSLMPFKYSFKSSLIAIYGDNLCPTNMTSYILNKFHIKEDEYWDNFVSLMIMITVFITLASISLIIKGNRIPNPFIKKDKNISVNMEVTECDVNECEMSENVGSLSGIQNMGSEIDDNDDEVSIETAFNLNLENQTPEQNPDINDKKLSIAWIDLVLKVDKFLLRKEKSIIKNINGFLEFGSLSALMGPSGAGKTSLLKCIVGMYDKMITKESKFFLSKKVKIRMCYIAQDHKEHLISGLTAKQSLVYASKLKNVDMDGVDHEKGAKALLDDLMISSCADTDVETCSGGEKKRIAIAMELSSVRKPNLLCLDEPTSGLDSNACELVVQCLKTLTVKHGISVITSIHQPNNDILMSFDFIYVLAKGGVCIYSGQPQNIRQYLGESDIQCTEHQIPIEVLLKIATKGFTDEKVIEMLNKTNDLQKHSFDRIINEMKETEKSVPITYRAFNIKRFYYLLMRSFTSTFNSWKSMLTLHIIYLLFGLFLRLLFDYDMEEANSCKSFNSSGISCVKSDKTLEMEITLDYNLKYNYTIAMTMLTFLIMTAILTVCNEAKVFIIEHRNGWYSPEAWYLTKTIVELIPTLIVIVCLCFVIDVYDRAVMFWCHLFFLTFCILCMQSYGHIFGLLISDPTISIAIGTTFQATFLLFCPAIIPKKEFNPFFQDLSNLSLHRLFIESILIVSYGFDRCTDDQFSSVLYSNDLNDDDLYRNGRLVVMELIGLRCLTLVIILLKTNKYQFLNKFIQFKNIIRKV